MMKIIVDEMPINPEDCPYSSRNENINRDHWIGCNLRSIVCTDTSNCQIFKDIKGND